MLKGRSLFLSAIALTLFIVASTAAMAAASAMPASSLGGSTFSGVASDGRFHLDFIERLDQMLGSVRGTQAAPSTGFASAGNLLDATAVGKQFRSVTSGNWGSTSTWEESTNGGSTWAAATTTPTAADGTVTVRAGHTVTVAASVTVDEVTIAATGKITVNPNQTLTLNGVGNALVNNGGTILTQGLIDGTGVLQTQSTASIDVESVTAIAISAPIDVNSGTATIFSNGVTPNVMDLTIDAGATMQPGNGNTFQVNGVLTNNGTIADPNHNSTFFIVGTSVVNNGAIGTAQFWFYRGGNGTKPINLSGSGSFSSNQVHVLNAPDNTGSSVVVTGSVAMGAPLTVHQGNTLTINGTLVLTSTLFNAGVVNGSGTLKTQGNNAVVDFAALDVALEVVSGTTTLTSGQTAFPTTNGTLTVDSGAVATVSNSNELRTVGDVSIAGTLAGPSASVAIKGASLVNDGTISAFNLYFRRGATTAVSGTGSITSTNIRIQAASSTAATTLSVPSGASFSVPSFLIENNGAGNPQNALTLNGGVTVTGTLNNSGLVNGSGTLLTQGTTTLDQNGIFTVPLQVVSGTTTVTSGATAFPKLSGFTVNSGATLTVANSNVLITTGDSTIAGTLNGSQFEFDGATLTNSGTIAVNSLLFRSGGTTTLVGSGSITSPNVSVSVSTTNSLPTTLTLPNGTSLQINNFLISVNNVLDVNGTVTFTGNMNNSGTVSGTGTFKTMGTTMIDQNGTFSSAFEIGGGVTTLQAGSTARPRFDGSLSVDTGATATIGSSQSLYTFGTTTIAQGSTLGGAGVFIPNCASLLNNGTVSAITYFARGAAGPITLSGTGAFTGTAQVTLSQDASTAPSTLKLGSDLQFASLAVSANNTLDLNGKVLKLNGGGQPLGIATGATFIVANSTVEMNGTTAQTVEKDTSGGTQLQYNSLTINDPAGVTLPTVGNPGFTIPGTLTLLSGVFTDGTNNLTMGNNSTIVRTGAASITNAPVFAGVVNLQYVGTSNVTPGPEMPTATNALKDLVVNLTGTAGNNVLSISSPITVNGNISVVAGVLSNNTTITTASSTTIGSGGVLGGAGRITGPVNVLIGGHIAPGNSPGILNTGSVTFNSGSNFDVEIGGPTVGTQYDQLNVTGSVTLGGAALNLARLSGYTPASGTQFTVLNNDGADAVTGLFTLGTGGTDANGGTLANGDIINNFLGIAGLNARINYNGGDGNDVVITANPPIVNVSTNGTLDFGNVTVGNTSQVQSYTVSGTGLQGDITVTAPAGFQVSTSPNSGFASSIAITPAGGTVNSTTIYVRYAPTAAGPASGSITNASANATTQSVAVQANAAPANCAAQPLGMVSWFRAEGNALDVRGNSGTLVGGATYAAGKVGQAFSLNGTDAYVQAQSLPSQDPTTAGSLDAWVNFAQKPSVSGHINTIIGRGGSGADLDLQAETDDHFHFFVGNGVQVVSTTTVQPGVWYHVTGTFDATSQVIYVDGVAEATGAGIARSKSGQPLMIGNQPYFGPRLFNGLIDEPEIFNRALTATEVPNIYNASTAGKCFLDRSTSGLAGWWSADGDTRDISGKGNDGTANGALSFTRGEVGQAFVLNGVDSSVSTASTPLAATDNWTMEAWINLGSLSQQGMVMSNGFDNGNTGDGYAFGIGNGCTGPSCYTSGNRLQALYGGVTFLDGGFTFTNTNQWYHVAMVRESGTLKFYVNGVQTPNTYTNTPLTPTQFRIGSQNGVRFFKGFIDEPAIYGRPLSPAEIQSLYDAGVAGKYKSVATPAGTNVQSNAGGDATVIFANVTGSGVTQQVPIDGSQYPALPQTPVGLYYDISTSAAYSGGATVCFHLPLVTTSQLFSSLRIDHFENGAWVDRTDLATINFASQTVCTTTLSSLSPFAIATAAPTAAGVTVSGRVLAPGGGGLRNASVTLMGSDGVTRRVITNAFGHYSFDSVTAGGSYLMGVESRRFHYTARVVQVSDSLSEVNFEPQE